MLGGDRSDAALVHALEALTVSEGLDERLDAVLEAAAEAGGLPARFIYITAADGRRLHLARARASPSAMASGQPTWTHPDVSGLNAASDQSAESAGSMPALEIPVEQAREQRSMPTPAGLMHAQPLVLGAELVGLVLLGPLVDGGQLGGRHRRRLEGLAPGLAAVARQAHREHALREEVAALTSREEVGRRLAGSALEIDRFVTVLLDLAIRSTRTDAGFVAVVDAQSDDLEIRARSGLPAAFTDPDLSPDSGVFDWDGAEGGALGLRGLEWAADNGIGSILAVPLLDDDRPLGVFALLNFGAGETFTEANLSLLGTYTEQIRLMLGNARLFADFRRRYLETLRGLAASLDARRARTAEHHARVEQVARSLAGALGAGPAEVQTVALAAAVHDIGLLAMTETEAFAADQEHPLIGAAMVEHLPLDPAVAEAIATHHEWYDGWGFPRGLRGEQVGRPGRILAVAEFMVEMAEAPVLVPGADPPRLASELELRRGSQLDPAATDAALHLLETGRLALQAPDPRRLEQD